MIERIKKHIESLKARKSVCKNMLTAIALQAEIDYAQRKLDAYNK